MCEFCAKKIVEILDKDNPLPPTDDPNYEAIDRERQFFGMRLKGELICPAIKPDEAIIERAKEIEALRKQLSVIDREYEKKKDVIDVARIKEHKKVEHQMYALNDEMKEIALQAHYRTKRTEFACGVEVKGPEATAPFYFDEYLKKGSK